MIIEPWHSKESNGQVPTNQNAPGDEAWMSLSKRDTQDMCIDRALTHRRLANVVICFVLRI